MKCEFNPKLWERLSGLGQQPLGVEGKQGLGFEKPPVALCSQVQS